jgi:CheY-like chemotaxis protein
MSSPAKVHRLHALDVDATVVLYVEDEPVNVVLMQALFEHLPGVQLVIARDCAEGLRVAASMNVALLLLDIRLPDCLGTELLEQLRHFEALQHTPAVAVTSEPGFDTRGTGFLEVWTKPLSTPAVARRLSELLAQRPRRPAVRRAPR